MSEHPAPNRPHLFEEYASFYDALYRDKDYEAECDFLEHTFREYEDRPTRSILDLGCGTGGHALPLARRGYEVVGIDMSPRMVAQSREKAARSESSVEFAVGDVRELNLGRTFDAVIAMFAVTSYQCTNEDLSRMFSATRSHLDEGGLFIFDAWFGPAVLAQRPTETVRTIELPNGERIARRAVPKLDLLTHTVEVRYTISKTSGERVVEEGEECHTVRFLFPQEISHFLVLAGFELLVMGSFMRLDVEPTEKDWNVSVVARAV